MNNILKILAYGLGGLALVVSSFVTFSALTGTPMHEMKAVGSMFPENVDAEVTEQSSTMLPDAEAEREADVRSPRQIYEGAASPLGAFALQDPFSAEELGALQDTLLIKIDELARRARDLDRREQQLEDDRGHIEDLYEQMVGLRTSVLEETADNEAASDEIARDRRVLAERESRTYAQMASLFEDTKPTEAARLLTSIYGPDEAARILVQLDDDRVRELVGAIQAILPEEARQYVMALQDLRAAEQSD
ncbi:MAG: hypothetical protein AAGB93_18680 [Planctomycetota bacterium]